MALPARFTPRNLTGRFILNPTLSDVAACEDMLREQGIANPALRRAVAGGVLSFNHYEDEIDGVERMWVQQDSGGKDCNVAVDLRVFDWQDRTHEDALFGPVVGRMRRITTDTRPDLRALPPLLRGGWTQETRRCGVLEYQYQFQSRLQQQCCHTADLGRDMGHRIITRRRAALRATRFGGWDGGGGGKFKLASGV
ncbi:hypothetical protein B0H14DRAFT_2619836 [Mycena olivaceomarginata]|nr:hypothetical protein B0H14DRAFT_2619836 [Mycena olivaceomarginata]